MAHQSCNNDTIYKSFCKMRNAFFAKAFFVFSFVLYSMANE